MSGSSKAVRSGAGKADRARERDAVAVESLIRIIVAIEIARRGRDKHVLGCSNFDFVDVEFVEINVRQGNLAAEVILNRRAILRNKIRNEVTSERKSALLPHKFSVLCDCDFSRPVPLSFL